MDPHYALLLETGSACERKAGILTRFKVKIQKASKSKLRSFRVSKFKILRDRGGPRTLTNGDLEA
jgi:hypothetical protein